MSKLEFLLQNAMRRTEAQAQKGVFPGIADGKAANGSSEASNFDALLQTLSGKGGGGQAQVQQSPLLIMPIGPATKDAESEQSGEFEDGEPAREDVSGDLGSQTDFAMPKQEAAPAVQAGFPSLIVPQPNPAPAQPKSPSATTPASLLELIRPKDDGDAQDMMQKLASASSLKASVLHQEAHFKPVPSSAVPVDASGQSQAGAAPPVDALQARNAEALLAAGHGIAAKDEGGKAAVAAAPAMHNETADPATSALILHRIASAVAAETAKTEMAGEGAPKVDQAPGSIVLKPSEGVLRVLNIQLHPVELGVVTVKMRLSGEQLEMELHTSSDETADILRKDSEKLSGLLRSSGYRADIVTIHVTTDAAQQDALGGQKQQWGAQSQSGGFQQGQAGQEERARRSSNGTDGTGHRTQGGTEDASAVGTHAGGVYL